MRLYRALVRLLPRDFRQEYEDELIQTALEQWADVRRRCGLVTQVRFWFRHHFALLRAALTLRVRTGVRGRPSEWANPRLSLGAYSRPLLRGWTQDVRHATRALRRRPGFSLAAILTLALGIGATTTMFSVVRSVLLRPLPYPDADRIVVLRQSSDTDPLSPGVSPANVFDLAESTTSLTELAFAESHGLRLIEEGRGYSLRTWLVSQGFLDALGVQPSVGRGFLPDEFVAGNDRVVALSHASWEARFGGDPGIIGRVLSLDGAPHTVVGVLPPGFGYPSDAELWGPRPQQAWDEDQRSRADAVTIGRLAEGATLTATQLELAQQAAQLADRFPESNRGLDVRLQTLHEHLVGDVRRPLWLLMGAVALLLLIATSNVAGLMLTRGVARAREYGLRGALGAGPTQVVRLVGTESLLLAIAGGLLGVVLAYGLMPLIRLLEPEVAGVTGPLAVDRAVLAMALAASIGCALLAGTLPAVGATRIRLTAALGAGPRGSVSGGPRSRLRDHIVVAEIALSLVLMVGAGLLVRSLDRMLGTDLGFEPDDKLAVQVWAYDGAHRALLTYFDDAAREIRGIPGVTSVGLTTHLPLADGRSLLPRPILVPVDIVGRPSSGTGSSPAATLVAIDTEFPATMGIALLSGRGFAATDQADTEPVALVNQAFVRRYFGATPAVGHTLQLNWRDGSSRQVVGVLADVRREGHEGTPQPEVYVPLSQAPFNGLTFVVAGEGDPAEIIAPVREALWAADPTQAAWAARPLSELLGDWSRQRRLSTLLLVSFASLSLVLSGMGVYGLMAFAVEQRTAELGVRRALGGTKADIIGGVLRRSATLAALGCSLGLVGALLIAQVLRSALYGVGPFDPMTFAGSSAFVLGVVVLAAAVPAGRAARVSPVQALRTDA